jgi:hypothetical protein
VKVAIMLVSVVIPDGMGAVSCSDNGYSVIYVDFDGHFFVATYMFGSILLVLIAIKQVFWDSVHKAPKIKYCCSFVLRICWPGRYENCYLHPENDIRVSGISRKISQLIMARRNTD